MKLTQLRERLQEIRDSKVIDILELEKVEQEIRIEKAIIEPIPDGYKFLERIATQEEAFNVYQKDLEILVRDFTVNEHIDFSASIIEYCEWFEEIQQEKGFCILANKGLKVIVKDNEKQTFSVLDIVPSKYKDVKKASKQHELTLHIYTESRYSKLIDREFTEVK